MVRQVNKKHRQRGISHLAGVAPEPACPHAPGFDGRHPFARTNPPVRPEFAYVLLRVAALIAIQLVTLPVFMIEEMSQELFRICENHGACVAYVVRNVGSVICVPFLLT